MFRDAKSTPTDMYSNRHDTRDRQNVSQLLVGGSEEKNYDAYTKIGGESARWQCVARHAHYLNDNSRFFTRTGGGGVSYVTFNTLWLNWASDFGKQYDIRDDAVVRQITGGGFPKGGVQVAQLDAMTWKDYDLDNSRSHH